MFIGDVTECVVVLLHSSHNVALFQFHAFIYLCKCAEHFSRPAPEWLVFMGYGLYIKYNSFQFY